MGVLAEVETTVEVDLSDLSTAGPGLVMWEAARSREQRFGSLLMATTEPGVLVASSACLLVHLLGRAGHHHRLAHRETLDGSLPADAAPLGRPVRVRGCPEPDPTNPPCDCAVETAGRILLPVIEGTGAESALAQVVEAFAADGTRTTLPWRRVSIAQATVLVDAAALLTVRYRGGTASALRDDIRARIAADSASRN